MYIQLVYFITAMHVLLICQYVCRSATTPKKNKTEEIEDYEKIQSILISSSILFQYSFSVSFNTLVFAVKFIHFIKILA